MTRTLLCAAALCVASVQAGLAGGLEDPVVTPPVIIEDMQAAPSISGQTVVLLSALVVIATVASTAK